MAKIASVNVPYVAGDAGPALIWNLVSLLTESETGWTILSSSDGLGSNGNGTGTIVPVVMSGSGVGGLNNQNAYICVKSPIAAGDNVGNAPDGGRKYLFQRSSGGFQSPRNWWIRYVRNAELLTPGTVTAMPTGPASVSGGAIDLQDILGSAAAFPNSLIDETVSANDGYAHAVLETDPENGVYQFWAGATRQITGQWGGGIISIGLDTTLASNGLDQDPAATQASEFMTANNGWCFWTRYGMSSSTWGFQFFNNPGPGFSSVNPYTGDDNGLGRIMGATGGSYGTPIKGSTNWCLHKASLDRQYPSTINLNVDAYVYVANGLLPWPNGVTPQL